MRLEITKTALSCEICRHFPCNLDPRSHPDQRGSEDDRASNGQAQNTSYVQTLRRQERLGRPQDQEVADSRSAQAAWVDKEKVWRHGPEFSKRQEHRAQQKTRSQRAHRKCPQQSEESCQLHLCSLLLGAHPSRLLGRMGPREPTAPRRPSALYASPPHI